MKRLDLRQAPQIQDAAVVKMKMLHPTDLEDECSSKSVGWSLFHEWQKHTEISLRQISSILEAAVDVIWCYINKNLKQAK